MRRKNKKKPINELSRSARQKFLLWGKRGYQFCLQTLRPLHDFDRAVLDENAGGFFESSHAQGEYYAEQKALAKRGVKP